uniref:Uncharacterized protein n=1 Tax=Anopheles dirus TaxID=7168 RepID=A0A182NYY3_9DIPT
NTPELSSAALPGRSSFSFQPVRPGLGCSRPLEVLSFYLSLKTEPCKILSFTSHARTKYFLVATHTAPSVC